MPFATRVGVRLLYHGSDHGHLANSVRVHEVLCAQHPQSLRFARSQLTLLKS